MEEICIQRIIFILLLIAFSLSACVKDFPQEQQSYNETSSQSKTNEMTETGLPTFPDDASRIASVEWICINDTYMQQFVEQPTRQFLIETLSEYSVFSLMEDGETIKELKKVNDTISEKQWAGVVHLMDDWGFDKNFLEFFEDENIKEFLAQNGVLESKQNIVVLHSASFPRTIWVATKSKNYFITVNELLEENFSEEKECFYRFYTSKQYKEKFFPKQGKLIFNGKEKALKNPPLFYHRTAFIPYCEIMELYGAKITWENDTFAKIITKEDTYSLDIKNNSLISKNTNKDLFDLNFGGGNVVFLPQSKEIMIMQPLMNYVYPLSNMKVEIDKENHVLSIIH